jgi:hypothetical protein
MSATFEPFPILETISPCGPEKVTFLSVFAVNCLGAPDRLSSIRLIGSKKENSFSEVCTLRKRAPFQGSIP